MRWKGKLLNYLSSNLKSDTKWKKTVESALDEKDRAIHLAIFTGPFLSLIFSNEKRVESRFSINKIAPFGKIKNGDIVFTKRSGGPIEGVFQVRKVISYRDMAPSELISIETQHGKDICTGEDPLFWEKRRRSKYATLIFIDKVTKLEPFLCEKRDRAGWSIVQDRN